MPEANMTIDFFDDDAPGQADRIYLASVDECAAERKNRFLSNMTTGHARYILAKIFENAQSEVRLWTNGMPREKDGEPMYASEELIRAAVSFLDKPDAVFSIIVNGAFDVDAGQGPGDHPFLRAIWDHEQAEAKTRVCQTRDPRNPDNVLDVHGFAVMDKTGYRAETKDDSTAVVNFGDHAVAESLAETFDSVMARAE